MQSNTIKYSHTLWNAVTLVLNFFPIFLSLGSIFNSFFIHIAKKALWEKGKSSMMWLWHTFWYLFWSLFVHKDAFFPEHLAKCSQHFSFTNFSSFSFWQLARKMQRNNEFSVAICINVLLLCYPIKIQKCILWWCQGQIFFWNTDIHIFP